MCYLCGQAELCQHSSQIQRRWKSTAINHFLQLVSLNQTEVRFCLSAVNFQKQQDYVGIKKKYNQVPVKLVGWGLRHGPGRNTLSAVGWHWPRQLSLRRKGKPTVWENLGWNYIFSITARKKEHVLYEKFLVVTWTWIWVIDKVRVEYTVHMSNCLFFAS